jgi:CcmD family protein
MNTPIALVIAFLGIFWSQEAPSVRAAAGDAPETAVGQSVEAEPLPAVSPVQGASGLPQRAPPPRTLREFWPVFAGFAAAWIGIVAYTLSFGRRLRRVGDELGRLDGNRSNP